MDNWPDGVSPDAVAAADTLSYDDTVAYEEQVPAPESASLANRIGSTKVYLLSETSVARAGLGKLYYPPALAASLSYWNGKRKHAEVEEEEDEADVDMDEDTSYRTNAILLHGPPISYLPTARLFGYAKHFDVQPMGLEWIDDTTCILVFPSKASARTAHRFLRKSTTETPDAEGFVTAKPIPIAFWPPEERINSSLGKGQGLKGTIRMRWATNRDVKQKGARQQSAFYKKHGRLAGKEMYGGEGPPAAKRRRSAGAGGADAHTISPELQREQLDQELDRFLAEDNDDEELSPTPSSPPSKMRSDYIASDGRTLLERTSLIRLHPDEDRPSLADRLTAPLPRRARNGALGKMHADDLSVRISSEKLEWGPSGDARQRGGRGERRSRRSERSPRRRMTQQELDDEMDAFLNEKE
ncbi:putative nuclear cap-binding protein subunit 3 [Lyophyllum shimeji]|uniref:Nuclear cap-binding protein subunit 3 n=1 Tax=Lyophyllum shimeji TaxID=47721 RepID=A0A9P3PC76_LYOSH|nr:putative nuclear cap-binding protein subunit 3 [Lyophyllum shimeji]